MPTGDQLFFASARICKSISALFSARAASRADEILLCAPALAYPGLARALELKKWVQTRVVAIMLSCPKPRSRRNCCARRNIYLHARRRLCTRPDKTGSALAHNGRALPTPLCMRSTPVCVCSCALTRARLSMRGFCISLWKATEPI